MKIVTVPGTWATPDDPRGEWWFPGAPKAARSEWWREMALFGLEPLKQGEPFLWSGDCDVFDRPFLFFRGQSDWRAGGDALRYYLEGVPLADRNIVAHSHGRQVALYCARQLPINRLVVLCGPVRGGTMEQVAAEARQNIGRWLHVYDPRWDFWEQAGELFDGHLGIRRADPRADVNLAVPHNRHDGVLYDQVLRERWSPYIAGFLRTGDLTLDASVAPAVPAAAAAS